LLENHFKNFPIFIPFLGKNELCLKAKKDYPGELYTHICNLTRCPLKARTQRVTMEDIVEAVKNLYHSYSSVLSKEDILAGLNQEKYCPYFFSYFLMQKADIIVTSYPFLENQALFTRLFYSIGIPLDQMLIAIDESHNLVKPVNQEISFSHVEKAIEEFPHEIYLELLDFSKQQQLVESYFDESRLKKLEEELFSLLQSQLMFNNPPSIYAYLVYHFLMTSQEKTMLADSHKVSIINIRPSEILHKLIYARRLVLISGSFEPLRSFQQIFNLPNSRILRVFPPKEEIDSRYFIVWNQRLNAKYENRKPEYYILVSSTIQNIVDSIQGHTLVFAPSYKYIKELEKTGILKPDVIESPELDITTLQTIIASAETNKLILCVIGGKIAEGIEFTHNGRSLIKGIIVTSLPYPPPSEESRLIFNDLTIQFGEKLAREFSVIIPMIQRLAQSFGRAIRNKGDKAVHILLDPRGTKYSSVFNFERHSTIKTLKEKIEQFFAK
jgi:Rad3-related DNA helicase